MYTQPSTTSSATRQELNLSSLEQEEFTVSSKSGSVARNAQPPLTPTPPPSGLASSFACSSPPWVPIEEESESSKSAQKPPQNAQNGDSHHSEASWEELNTENSVNESANASDLRPPRTRCVSISRNLRNHILDRFPALKDHNGHRCFKGLMLFSGHRTEDGMPIIPAERVAKCYGIDYEGHESNFVISRILEIYKRDVDPDFEWREHRYVEGKAREVAEWGVGREITAALEREYVTKFEALEDPVNWQTGRKIDSKFISNEGDRLMEKATTKAKGMSEQTRRWLRYMNSRPARPFREQVDPMLDKAWDIALELEKEDARNGARHNLREIAKMPKPYYEPTNNTPRIFAPNSIASVKREIRKVLSQGWVEYDLSSAQLAIISREWELEGVEKFLRTDRSIWESISEHSGLGMRFKPLFKKALYSMCYGAGQKNILEIYIPEEAEDRNLQYCKEIGERILSHPIFDILKEARNDQIKRVIVDGGAYDCWGRWLDLEERRTPSKNEKKDRGDRWAAASSILCQQMQSIEMDLLEPALALAEEELAKSRKAFQIVLQQHDGFSVKFHSASGYHHKRIVKAVNDKCQRLGYPTELEFERL